jgi:hypothetical protein
MAGAFLYIHVERKNQPMLRLLLIIGCLTGSQVAFSQAGIIVLKGGTVVDVDNYGSSTKDLKNAVVIIENGKIKAVGAAGRVRIPAQATVIDVTGKYIVPGLIEGFGSVVNQAFANAYLYMGVTTVVSVEDNRRGKVFEQAVPSPALYRQEAYWGADRIQSKKPNQLYENVNYRSDEQIAREIDSIAQNGFKILLIHYGVKKEQLPAILAACKKNKLVPVGELGHTYYTDAVKAGIKSFVHTSRYSADILPDSVRSAYSDAPFGPPARFFNDYLWQHNVLADPKLLQLADLYGKHGTGLMPTGSLLVYPYMPFSANPWQETIASIINEKDIIHEPLDKATGKPVNPPPYREKNAYVLLRIDSLFIKKGARYLTGSGATAFGTLPGISLHTEMEVLSHAGLGNRQVLAAATNNFSLLWDWTQIGKIEAGRDADILVLTGDPVQSLKHLKQIDLLFVKGKQIDRKSLMHVK